MSNSNVSWEQRAVNEIIAEEGIRSRFKPYRLRVIERDIPVILDTLENANHPVFTPRQIERQTDIPYRRVHAALNAIFLIQRLNARHCLPLLAADGSQYQNFIYHFRWIPKEARK